MLFGYIRKSLTSPGAPPRAGVAYVTKFRGRGGWFVSILSLIVGLGALDFLIRLAIEFLKG